jgi:lysophospholipase L1-like esterase
VSLLVGVNDVVRGVSLERYRANVERIVAEILRMVTASRVVVVATPDYTRTPSGATYGDPQQQRAAIRMFNEALAALCKERGIAFVDIGVVADAADSDRSLISRDGLHPSAEQYARWVTLIAPVVEARFRDGQPATPTSESNDG